MEMTGRTKGFANGIDGKAGLGGIAFFCHRTELFAILPVLITVSLHI
jgi:hypothetical protein